MVYSSFLILGGSGQGATHVHDILEWDPAQSRWTMMGNMTAERAFHAASYIEFDESVCQSPIDP